MKWRWYSNTSIAAVLLAMGLLAASLAPHLRPSTEAVRLRNALLFDQSGLHDFDWTPSGVPSSYRLDRQAPTALFSQVAQELKLAALPSDWDRALRIAQHLVIHATSGGAAQSDLEGTYRQIIGGGGYCADYTTVFIAIAKSAGVFSREWAFSFDGFGGYGHALIEVYDAESGQWRMLDVFNNFYPVDRGTGQPMSVVSFRQHVMAGQGTVDLRRISAGRLGFKDDSEVYAYYHRGIDQWYLWWGNAVFDYDASLATRLMGPVSRSAEQLTAIALGVHPRIRPVPTEANASMRQRMFRLQWRLFATAIAGAALILLLLAQSIARLKIHRTQGHWHA